MFRLSESALQKHLDSHPRATATPKPAPPAPRRKRSRAPTPILEDEESPATSRSEELSTRTPRTAREKVERLVDSLQSIVDEVNKDRDVTVAEKLTVLRAMVSPLRLLGTFTGEIGASESTVASSPFYQRVRAAVRDALRPHPAATADVIAALERIERGGIDVEAAAE